MTSSTTLAKAGVRDATIISNLVNVERVGLTIKLGRMHLQGDVASVPQNQDVVRDFPK